MAVFSNWNSPSVTGWLAIKSQCQNFGLFNLKTYYQHFPYNPIYVWECRVFWIWGWTGFIRCVSVVELHELMILVPIDIIVNLYWYSAMLCISCKVLKISFNLATPGKSSLYPHRHNLGLVNINDIFEPHLIWTSIVASKNRGAQQVGLQQNETGPEQLLRKCWENDPVWQSWFRCKSCLHWE